MNFRRAAIIYDNERRPETTGLYCHRALEQLLDKVVHFLPGQVQDIPRSGFDLYLNIDDGLHYRLPPDLHPCAWWAIDTHMDAAWAAEKGRDFDWLFAAQRDGAEMLTKSGIPAQWLPLALDPAIHRPHPLAKRWDVTFVGRILPGVRQDLLMLLQREFPNSFIGQAYFEEYARVNAQSRIGFNRSIKNDVNMRVFETAGCGTFLMTNDLRDNGQEELFNSDKHLVTYQSAEELLDKLRFYIGHPEARERIAQAGYSEAISRHTYRHRMQSLLQAIENSNQTVVGIGLPMASATVADSRSTENTSPDQSPNSPRPKRQDPNPKSAWLDQIDVIIKTFLRPQALSRLLHSILQFYPHAHVTIADDGNLRESTDPDSLACCRLIDANNNIVLHTLPFAAGVTPGRNFLVDQTHRPYLLLLDDDFCFTAETRIERFLERLQADAELGVIAGACIDVVGDERQPRNSGGTLRVDGDTLFLESKGWRNREVGLRDYIPQFGLIRREVFAEVRWDGGIGAEHYDFCLQLQRSRWKVAQDLSVKVDHYHFTPTLPGYAEHRFNYAAAQQWLLQKWNLRQIVQDGQVIIERTGSVADASLRCTPLLAALTGEKELSLCQVPLATGTDRNSAANIGNGHSSFGTEPIEIMSSTLSLPTCDAEISTCCCQAERGTDKSPAACCATSSIPDESTSTLRTLPVKDTSYFEHSRPEVVALIPATARHILDIGCGAGALGALLKERQPAEVVGIELQPAAASVARQRLDQVLEQSVEDPALDFESGRFDCIVCADVLEHLREPAQILAKIRRWLTPDGTLVASLPNTRHHSVVGGLIEGNWTYETAGLLDSDHVRFFTRREIEKLFYRTGFEIRQLQGKPGSGYEDWQQAGCPGEVRIGAMYVTGLATEQASEFFTYQYLVAAHPIARPAQKLTSIVIVTYNQLAFTKECIDSIRLRTDEPYELVFVDNGSTDGTVEYLRNLRAGAQPSATDELSVISGPSSTEQSPLRAVQLIENLDNRGFPVAANQGLRIARGDYVVLLNNDTVVTTRWLGHLHDVLESDPHIGLVGPCSNWVSSLQLVSTSYADMASLDGFAWELGKQNAGVAEETDRLIGFCLAIKRIVIEQIGLLDERFGIGCFEDDDLCLRAIRAGWRVVIARASFVHHYGHRTFQGSGVDLEAVLEMNREKFLDKWSGPSPSCEPQPNATWPEGEDPGSPVPLHDEARRSSASSPSSSLVSPASIVDPRPAAQPRFRLTSSPTGGFLLQLNKAAENKSEFIASAAKPHLSLCMIVRDNATTIDAALESIGPYVDEIVIVDTGSQDATLDICRQHGARIFEFPWCDDFSAARNESLKHARGKWIFWMDSDDTISPECARQLRALADGPHADNVLGYIMQVHCPGPGSEGQFDVTAVDHVKLIRNRPDLRFTGRIHEQLLPAIRLAGGEVAWTDIHVRHSGADHSPAGWQRELDRDLRILHLELGETPNHPFVLFNLGMTYADAKRYNEAIGYLQRCLAVSTPDESHLRKTFALLVNALSQADQHDTAWTTCQQGLILYPEDKELLFRSAILHHHFGRLPEAAQTYQRVLDNRESRHFTSIDRGLAGFKARHNLAIVYDEMGRLDLAEAEWRRIVAEVSDYPLGWRGLGEILLRQGKAAESERLCDQLSQSPAFSSQAPSTAQFPATANPRLANEARILRGKLAAARGDVSTAVRELQAARTISPHDLEPLRLLCRVLFEQGEPAAAQAALLELTEMAPDDASAHYNLGTIRQRLKQPQTAARAFRDSLKIRPNSPMTHLQLGYALKDCGLPADAALSWKSVLQLDPSNDEARFALTSV